MIVNYLIKILSKIFALLMIPTILCVLFDAATGMITITAGTIIFIITMFMIFGSIDVFINRDKKDDGIMNTIDFIFSPRRWITDNLD